MTIIQLRAKRIAAEISATHLSVRAKVNRSRLTDIERGYTQPTEVELKRLHPALEELIRAKSAIDQVAASVGSPGSRHDN
jgi:transcriptional regulator with XRE-family HTH domain